MPCTALQPTSKPSQPRKCLFFSFTTMVLLLHISRGTEQRNHYTLTMQTRLNFLIVRFHHCALMALPILFLLCFALIVLFFTFGEADLNFDTAIFVMHV